MKYDRSNAGADAEGCGCLMIMVIVIMVLFYVAYEDVEISLENYKVVKQHCEEYPEYQQGFDNLYSDQKIDRNEFRRLEKYYKYLELQKDKNKILEGDLK